MWKWWSSHDGRKRSVAPTLHPGTRAALTSGSEAELAVEPGDLAVDQRQQRRRRAQGVAAGRPTSRSRRAPARTGSTPTSGRRPRTASTACADRGLDLVAEPARPRVRSTAGAAGRGRPASRRRTSPAASIASHGQPVAGDRRGQAVGPRQEQLLAEQAAGAGSARARSVERPGVVLVEQHRQLVPGEAARCRGEQQQRSRCAVGSAAAAASDRRPRPGC